jgi:hypothetical protein
MLGICFWGGTLGGAVEEIREGEIGGDMVLSISINALSDEVSRGVPAPSYA